MFRRKFLSKNPFTFPIKSKQEFPEKLKGTFVEKWKNYWTSLYLDYKGMLTDLITDIQEKPRKALVLSSAFVIAIGMAKNNPDETDFNEQFHYYCNHVLLVAESCRNPKTVSHFTNLHNHINEGVLRRTNLGIASFLWVDDYSQRCDLYKTKCNYIQPKYTSIPSRIVDVGIFGRWWNMYIKFQDFDVNS